MTLRTHQIALEKIQENPNMQGENWAPEVVAYEFWADSGRNLMIEHIYSNQRRRYLTHINDEGLRMLTIATPVTLEISNATIPNTSMNSADTNQNSTAENANSIQPPSGYIVASSGSREEASNPTNASWRKTN